MIERSGAECKPRKDEGEGDKTKVARWVHMKADMVPAIYNTRDCAPNAHGVRLRRQVSRSREDGARVLCPSSRQEGTLPLWKVTCIFII